MDEKKLYEAGSPEFDAFVRGDQWTPEQLAGINKACKPIIFNMIGRPDYPAKPEMPATQDKYPIQE